MYAGMRCVLFLKEIGWFFERNWVVFWKKLGVFFLKEIRIITIIPLLKAPTARANYPNYNNFCLFPSSAWLLFLLFQFLSILPSFISVCKGTHNFFPFPKNAEKLPHFNIRSHGFLTIRHPSMRHIAMVDE